MIVPVPIAAISYSNPSMMTVWPTERTDASSTSTTRSPAVAGVVETVSDDDTGALMPTDADRLPPLSFPVADDWPALMPCRSAVTLAESVDVVVLLPADEPTRPRDTDATADVEPVPLDVP